MRNSTQPLLKSLSLLKALSVPSCHVQLEQIREELLRVPEYLAGGADISTLVSLSRIKNRIFFPVSFPFYFLEYFY